MCEVVVGVLLFAVLFFHVRPFVVMNAECGTRSSSPIVIDSDSCVESDSDAGPVQVRGSPLKVLHSKRYR